jgi:eukaryotic-like serine/threonine-protein kinase
MAIMGPYELLELIGGGMSQVYVARHRDTGEAVAVKMLREDAAADPVLLGRFLRECSALVRLSHPNIVKGLEVGEEDGLPYLVMEYVKGETLGQRIFREGPLPLDEALKVFSQIAAALGHIHQQNFVHRDVKPDNILLSQDGRAKLADLGLTKDLSVAIELTGFRAGMGTLAYAAPEQFETAAAADARSDVYALGASLYHALTGVPPFQGQVTLVVLRQKMTNDFLPPGRLLPHLPSGIDHALCRSMSSDPNRRQGSCEEWLDSLTNLKPVKVPRPAPAENRRKTVRFPSVMKAYCSPATGTHARWSAEVRDLSLTGACLELRRRMEPGTSVRVALLDDTLRPIFPAVIKWVRSTIEGVWWHGCQFSSAMTDHELMVLLGGLTKTEPQVR